MLGVNEELRREEEEPSAHSKGQMKLTSFFIKKPVNSLADVKRSASQAGENSTKRVKVVGPESIPTHLPLRAPSPTPISPSMAKEIEERKLNSLRLMESKRMTRVTRLERDVLPESWFTACEEELNKPYFLRLKEFLQGEWDRSVKVFPPMDKIYSWAQLCPNIDAVKVVILGQDPYHNDGQAMGLAFSVPPECRPLPPSLVNIYKELAAEYPNGEFTIPKHGSLVRWAKQGVLLLNATLTVRAHEPASHANRGWEPFTDQVISFLNKKFQNLVFFLWGNHAQKKGGMIDKQRHLVLTSAHPSPLSASRGFFGCGHFRRANEYLLQHGKSAIDWNDLKPEQQ